MVRREIEAGKAVIVLETRNRVSQGLRRLRSEIRRFAFDVGRIGASLAIPGIAFTGGLQSGLGVFTEFQDGLLFLRTIVDGTDSGLKNLEKTIKTLGRTTSFTATEVLGGAVELARGGFSPSEIQDLLKPALDLSRSGGVSLSDAGNILANITRTFDLTTDSAGRAASLIVKAANTSTTSVESIIEGLKEVSGTATTLQADLPTTLALLSQEAFSSLTGTKAGTSLNTQLLNLTKNAKKLQQVFGVSSIDSQGNVRNLIELISEIKEASLTLGTAEIAAGAQDVFNIRGGRALTALIRDVDLLVNRYNVLTNVTNEAAKATETIESRLGGAIRELKAAGEGFVLKGFEKAEPEITAVVDGLKAFTTGLTGLITPEIAKTLITIPPLMALIGGSMIASVPAMLLVAASLTPIIKGWELATAALGKFIAVNRGLANSIIPSSILPKEILKGREAAAIAPLQAIKAQVKAQQKLIAQEAKALKSAKATAAVRALNADNLNKQRRAQARIAELDKKIQRNKAQKSFLTGITPAISADIAAVQEAFKAQSQALTGKLGDRVFATASLYKTVWLDALDKVLPKIQKLKKLIPSITLPNLPSFSFDLPVSPFTIHANKVKEAVQDLVASQDKVDKISKEIRNQTALQKVIRNPLTRDRLTELRKERGKEIVQRKKILQLARDLDNTSPVAVALTGFSDESILKRFRTQLTAIGIQLERIKLRAKGYLKPVTDFAQAEQQLRRANLLDDINSKTRKQISLDRKLNAAIPNPFTTEAIRKNTAAQFKAEKKVADLRKDAQSKLGASKSPTAFFLGELGKGIKFVTDSFRKLFSNLSLPTFFKGSIIQVKRFFFQLSRSAKALTFADLVKGLGKVTKFTLNLVTSLKDLGKFLFSFNGLFFVADLLLIFGTNLPIIGDAIGNIRDAIRGIDLSDLKSDFKLLGSTLKTITSLLSQGRVEEAIDFAKDTLSKAVKLIGIDLVNAWRKFSAQLEPTFAVFRAGFNGLLTIVDAIDAAIKSTLGPVFSSLNSGIDVDPNNRLLKFAGAITVFANGAAALIKGIGFLGSIIGKVASVLVSALTLFARAAFSLVKAIPGFSLETNKELFKDIDSANIRANQVGGTVTPIKAGDVAGGIAGFLDSATSSPDAFQVEFSQMDLILKELKDLKNQGFSEITIISENFKKGLEKAAGVRNEVIADLKSKEVLQKQIGLLQKVFAKKAAEFGIRDPELPVTVAADSLIQTNSNNEALNQALKTQIANQSPDSLNRSLPPAFTKGIKDLNNQSTSTILGIERTVKRTINLLGFPLADKVNEFVSSIPRPQKLLEFLTDTSPLLPTDNIDQVDRKAAGLQLKPIGGKDLPILNRAQSEAIFTSRFGRIESRIQDVLTFKDPGRLAKARKEFVKELESFRNIAPQGTFNEAILEDVIQRLSQSVDTFTQAGAKVLSVNEARQNFLKATSTNALLEEGNRISREQRDLMREMREDAENLRRDN